MVVTGARGTAPALDELDRQTARDYDTRMAEREAKEAATGRKLRGPKPSAVAARRSKPRGRTRPIRTRGSSANASKGVVQGYNPQAAATGGHIIVAAEIGPRQLTISRTSCRS